MGTPWFKLFPRDFLTDSKVKLLSREHRSILLDLWCYCAMDGSIPNDAEALSRILGESISTTKKTLEKLRVFFIEEDGKLYSKRLRGESEAYEEKCKRLRESASKGGRARAAKGKAKAKAIAPINGEENVKQMLEQMDKQTLKQNPAEAEAEAEVVQTPNGVCRGESALQLSPPAEVVLELPCSGGKPWPVTEAMLAEWRKVYPDVDVLAEARKMRLWLQASPERMKTQRGMGRFALGWLGRAHKPPEGPIRASPAPPRKCASAEASHQAQVSGLTFKTLSPTGAP